MEAGGGFRRCGPGGPAAAQGCLGPRKARTTWTRSAGDEGSARPPQHLSLPRLLPSAGLDPLQLQAPDPSGQRTGVCGDGGQDAQAAPEPGTRALLLLPGSPRTSRPRGSNPSVVRPRLPPAEQSESQELLSAQPPPLTPHRPLGFVESFSKMWIMSYDCAFHLLLTPGGLAPSPARHSGAPGETRDEAARSPSLASPDHVSIHPSVPD